MPKKRRASEYGCHGRIPTQLAGCATPSISARFHTPIFAMKISARVALRDHVDVLLYGHVDLELAEQIQGLPKAWGPMPFKKTPQTPSFGTPAESDDITGGIGWEGLAQIQHFVEDGGLLVTLGSGSHAGSRRRHGARRAAFFRRRSAQHARRRCRCGRRGAASSHSDSWCTCARDFRPARIIHWPTDTRRKPTCSARISRSTMCRDAGCVWPTAPPVLMVQKTAATSSWNGAPKPERHLSSAARPGAKHD